jgi:acetyl-CoA carboxylase biotin carboxylase subunit
MAAGLSYRGVGTLEFLYQDGEFYFIEMNTRIQVEHPVTECVTGIDIVRMQIELAASGRLDLVQEDVEIRGHSIECRVNAEDEDFNPSPGLIHDLILPGGYGVRVDTHLYNEYKIPHQYDSLIAKIVTKGDSRHEALVRMRRALAEFSVQGIDSNVGLHKRVCDHDSFINAAVDTNFLEREII